eukprot:16444948-Heterocapsa_arctica.AAC.1
MSSGSWSVICARSAYTLSLISRMSVRSSASISFRSSSKMTFSRVAAKSKVSRPWAYTLAMKFSTLNAHPLHFDW